MTGPAPALMASLPDTTQAHRNKRAILAALIVAFPERLPMTALASLVWLQSPPINSALRIRANIFQINRMIREHGWHIASKSSGTNASYNSKPTLYWLEEVA